MAPDSFWPMWELLMRQGVEWTQARSRAVNILRSWELDEVEAILSKIKRPSPDYCLFKSAEIEPTRLPPNPEDRNALQKWWPSLWRTRERWIAPSRELIEQSAKEGLALCVDENGTWSLLSEGYVALSHVWVEGLQRDERYDGVEHTKISKVFELLHRAGLQSKWIWTDVLVIPGGGNPTSSLEDELLTIDLINSMPTVYGRAEAVLIIDAVVVQVHSTDPRDIAVALCVGRWATRVWTFQEIKLANRAVIVTATGGIEFSDMVNHLKELGELDRPRYHRLYQWAAIMAKSDTHRLTLRDLVSACGDRSSGFDIDYARAFFPVLGLTWESGMTREQGMERIYRAYSKDAAVIAPFAGSPRMKRYPAWAPSYLRGLEGVGHHDLQSEERGLRGEWHVLKIVRLVDTTLPQYGKVGLNVEVECDQSPRVQCVVGPGEDPEVIDAVKTMIGNGRGWILSVNSFTTCDTEWARSILLVEEAHTSPEDGMEVAVYCSAIMGLTVTHLERRMSLLIRHWNPNVDNDLVNLLKYSWYRQEERSLPVGLAPQEGESALHSSVRNADLGAIERLISEGHSLDVFDSRGYTPLHTAAARGRIDVLELLLLQCTNLEVRSQTFNKDTPLTWTATEGTAESINILLDHGAEIESRNKSGNTALMCASYNCHARVVATLLARGANPNARNGDGKGESALILASGRNGLGIEVLRLLVEHKAEINARHAAMGWTPLLRASDQGNDSEVAFLLSAGAEPNVYDATGHTPLTYAVTNGRESSVRMLLDHGADREAVLGDGLRPIHLAAQCANYKITQMLLEGNVPLDINVCTSDRLQGRSALHYAVLNGEPRVVKLLLQKGADVNARDIGGQTPSDYSVSSKNSSIQELLADSSRKKRKE